MENTILHHAAKTGDAEEAKKILQTEPAILFAQNAKGDTPLHTADRLGHLGVAEVLVGPAEGMARKLLEAQNLAGDTALHEAARNGHCSVVVLLMDRASGTASFVNLAGESALYVAVDRAFYEAALVILEGFPYTYHDELSRCCLSGRRGMTVVHAAVLRMEKSE